MAAHLHPHKVNHGKTDQCNQPGVNRCRTNPAYCKVIRNQKIRLHHDPKEAGKNLRKRLHHQADNDKIPWHQRQKKEFRPPCHRVHFMKMLQVMFHSVLLFTSTLLSFSVVAPISEILSWFKALKSSFVPVMAEL